MHIKIYIRRLEKFLQQTFNKKRNISLFVSRRSKYVHLGLDIPLLSTRVSSELIATIKDFEEENRYPKYLFIFPRLIQTKKMIISYLKRKISNKASVKVINKTKKQFKGKITFRRCYGLGILLVTIDLKGFELYHGRLFPADW